MNTLLVVDDEAHIRHLYQIFFSQEGYQVLEAADVDAAGEILNNEHVDLVLLDLRMPRISGSILHEYMSLFYQKVPVIICSVYPIEQQKEFAPGALDYFDKAEGLLKLLNKIDAVLRPDPLDSPHLSAGTSRHENI